MTAKGNGRRDAVGASALKYRSNETRTTWLRQPRRAGPTGSHATGATGRGGGADGRRDAVGASALKYRSNETRTTWLRQPRRAGPTGSHATEAMGRAGGQDA